MRVAMVSTPDDGSCGIGTYAGDLSNAFTDVSVEPVELDQAAMTVRHFFGLAARAVLSDADVIHVQHEYGLYRHDESRWPGVFGLVFFPALFALNLVADKPVVITFHSVLNPDADEAPLHVRAYLAAMHWVIAGVTDHVIFLSEDCAHRFLADVDIAPESYSVLSHGANVEEAEEIDETEAKRTFGYDPDDTVVMIPGYVRPPKGHHVFIAVAKRMPGYEFLIAGGARPAGADQEYAGRVENMAPDNVTVAGVLDDHEFQVAFNAADLALLPYLVVTQSGTFNWCAAHELPTVTSDVAYFERMEREYGNVETCRIRDKEAVVTDLEALRDADSRGIRETVDGVLSSQTRRDRLVAGMRTYDRVNSFTAMADRHRERYAELVQNRRPLVDGTPASNPVESLRLALRNL